MPKRVLDVKNCLHSNNVTVVGLLENKLNSKQIDDLKLSMGGQWQVISNVDTCVKCRILIIFNTDVWNAQVYYLSDQHISVVLTNVGGAKFMCTFIYAQNFDHKRKKLWDNLILESRIISLPWLLLGDFNCIRFSNDKLGGTTVPTQKMQEVDCFLHASGLLELSTSGFDFTQWSGPAKNILTKIDRVLCNVEWTTKYNMATIKLLPSSSSDHTPILVQFDANYKKSIQKPFKFMNHWTLADGYNTLIENAWKCTEEAIPYMFSSKNKKW